MKAKKSSKKAAKKKEEEIDELVPAVTAKKANCVCEKKRKYWYCMKIKPDGSKIQCLGPYETKSDCELEAHFCDS